MEQTCVLARARYLSIRNSPSGSSSPDWKRLKSMTAGSRQQYSHCLLSVRRVGRKQFAVSSTWNILSLTEAMELVLCRMVDVSSERRLSLTLHRKLSSLPIFLYRSESLLWCIRYLASCETVEGREVRS
jgi:hypothetical protein